MKAIKLLLIAVIAIAAIIGISKLLGLISDSGSGFDPAHNEREGVSTLYKHYEEKITGLKSRNWNKQLNVEYQSAKNGILREIEDKLESKALTGKLDDVYLTILYEGAKQVFKECKSDEITQIQNEVKEWKQLYSGDERLDKPSTWLQQYDSARKVVYEVDAMPNKAQSLNDKFNHIDALNLNVEATEWRDLKLPEEVKKCQRLMNRLERRSITSNLNERHYAFITSLVDLYTNHDFTGESAKTRDEFILAYEKPILEEIAKYSKMEIYESKKTVSDLITRVVEVKEKYTFKQ
jgi:hypothetical protein